ncbi:hypothetical protein AB837_00535 [bacterium AB1]|nr:hypothetical protein AB837_00535 [bacterium AB1]
MFSYITKDIDNIKILLDDCIKTLETIKSLFSNISHNKQTHETKVLSLLEQDEKEKYEQQLKNRGKITLLKEEHDQFYIAKISDSEKILNETKEKILASESMFYEFFESYDDTFFEIICTLHGSYCPLDEKREEENIESIISNLILIINQIILYQ